jgi:FkbM family methyltransferase
MLIKFLKRINYKNKATSYSQAGEDAILRFLFNDYGKKRITYLDLGSNMPNYGNNTYWFYKNKSKGVCVDADINLVNQIKKMRKRDTVIHSGISTSNESEGVFYLFDEPALNTFSLKEVNARIEEGNHKVVGKINVKLQNINKIISENFETYPDLLSIDIEGLDFQVLNSLDYNKYPIPVLCVETCEYSENHVRPKNTSFIKLLNDKGYEVYADTYINTIFVNKKWFYNKVL